MPSSNMPDPDKIPDMTLPPRADEVPAKPAQPSTAFDRASELPTQLPASAPISQPTSPPDWQEGDRVLAPWEPMFLYPGIIRQIRIDDARGDQTLIDYDDGGQGWVFAYSLCTFEFRVGEQVQHRRDGGNQFHPAEVVEVRDGFLRIRYDDGTTELASLTALRFPCVENGPGAVATQFAPFQSPSQTDDGGSGIPAWAIWLGIWILATVLRLGCR
ncbi:MAG: hypothetical protein FJ303_04950 [Planctomycetes bacterium]|nr:hypothetical protein [Planctomycetota bacterium]